jgi:hypothetical protein
VAQQQQLGLWFALPLSLAFILFVISAFAETNRLPFDMPEAESELVTGYHTEYSAMKFSAFMISEFGHMVTASALMATLFLGGWDIPFWTGDNAFWHEGQLIAGFAADGSVILAEPTWWKTLLTFFAFAAKTASSSCSTSGSGGRCPGSATTRSWRSGGRSCCRRPSRTSCSSAEPSSRSTRSGVPFGFGYGLVLTAVSAAATFGFVYFLDRGRTITGAAAHQSQRVEMTSNSELQPTTVGE